MKKIGCCGRSQTFLILFLTVSLFSFSQDFTWKKGSNAVDQAGICGNIGLPAPLNNPGGRSGSASWKDANGNFWIFGGDGFDYIGNSGYTNDLWKYDLTTNQWTWVKGDNVIDQLGNYGTKGVAAASNKPGCRTAPASWRDAAGNFWIFGGFGYDALATLGLLNDLWKYNITTNQWTWISGNNLANQLATYGTMGGASASNIPGARKGGAAWVDANGNMWMFGGYGSTTSSSAGDLNDMWKYDITSNQWTWMKGSTSLGQNGTYGTLGSSAPGNNPGGRSSAMSWSDNSGNLWLFGGAGYDALQPVSAYLNDQWKYNISTNEWTWIKGSNQVDQNGTYGTQGSAAPANIPGARYGGITWVDAIGTVWLFGGEGFGGTTLAIGDVNDLWKYNPSGNLWTWIKGSSLIDQAGIYGTLGTPGINNRPGGRHEPVRWIDASNNLWLFGGYGYGSSSTNSGALNDLWKYTNCFISPITMTIIAKDSTICSGESTSLTVTGSNNYLWAHNLSTSDNVVITPAIQTTYSVYTSDANGCVYTAAFTETVSTCDGIEAYAGANKTLLYPNPSNGSFNLINGNSGSHFVIYNALGQVVFEKTLMTDHEMISTSLASGAYHYKISDGALKSSGKLIVE